MGVKPVLVDGFEETVFRIGQESVLAGNQHFAVGIVQAVEAGIRVAGDEVMGFIHIFQAVHIQLHGHQHSPLGQGCKACQRQGSGKQDRNDLFHFQPSMHKFFRFGCILAHPRHSVKRKAARKVRAA